MRPDGQAEGALELLGRDYPAGLVARALAWLSALAGPRTREQIEIEAAYAGYLDRQAAESRLPRATEALELPDRPRLRAASAACRTEAREKLRPPVRARLAPSGACRGITPAASRR